MTHTPPEFLHSSDNSKTNTNNTNTNSIGTSFFLTERMMRKEPGQVLPITSVQVGMSALISGAWAFFDGGTVPFSLPTEEIGRALENFGLNSHSVPVWAVVWTGLITTALNRLGETAALGKMSTSEASVLLATEPLFAAMFGFFLTHRVLGRTTICWRGPHYWSNENY